MAKTRDTAKIALFLLQRNDEERPLDLPSFARAAKLSPERFEVHECHFEAPTIAMLEGASAVIIGGARYSVWEEEIPHGKELIAVLRAARERKIPILGVCFGAQLIAHVFGGKVVRGEPANQEWGTFDVSTTDDSLGDIVFADLPFTFPAQQAHQDRIVALPPGSTLLATSDRCETQAFVITGADVYGVQFHPERSKPDYEKVLAIRDRAGQVSKEKIAAIHATLKETPDAESVIAKFIDRIVLQR